MVSKKIKQEIIIYKNPAGKIELRTDVQHDTVWATQMQIAEIFDVDVRTINEHIKNIYRTAELQDTSTIRKFRIVQKEGPRSIEREIQHYNLDMIIAVGYRVNSKKATQFRIWATSILHDHLLKGYTIHQKRLEKSQAKLGELNKMIAFITNVRNKRLTSDEASGLLGVIKDYADSWLLLHKYDQGELKIRKGSKKGILLAYEEAQNAVAELKLSLFKAGEAADVFGQERDRGLQGILQTLGQTFGGKELYRSLDEKEQMVALITQLLK
jgi:hypothetical protein